jgi:glycosyltransferase involved in cell wall biosynthesis
LSPARGATSGASITTDPARARRVIAASRRDFDQRYPDAILAPVVGLICAYEEEANIGAVLEAMPTEACGLRVTTLVVVDGGSDATDKVSMESGALTFVLRENLGHGYALRVGYALCIELGARYVVTLDADGQNDPAEIPLMLQPLVDDEADFVVASRVLGTDTTTDRFRKAGVRVFSWVMSAMGHTKLTDTSNGYRALRVSMLDDVAYRLVQTQYQTAELLIIAMKRGWRVTERPTRWLPRASGTTKKGKNWLFGFRYARVVGETWWKVRREPPHTMSPASRAASARPTIQ